MDHDDLIVGKVFKPKIGGAFKFSGLNHYFLIKDPFKYLGKMNMTRWLKMNSKI